MTTVRLAIDALRKAAAGKGKGTKELKDAIDHVASCLTLLNSTSLPLNSMEKLNNVLRKPMIPLYIAFPFQALHFSATVFACIFSDKVSTALEIGDEEVKKSWEMIQRSILSGILDYIEANNSSHNKDIAAKVLFSVICDIYFPTSSTISASSSLQCTAYTLLCEIATSHSSNKQKLRDPQILGGKRLGTIMSQSKDFLVLESLLNLFAVILPSTNNSSLGRAKRAEFIRDVFDSPQTFTCGKEVVQVLESVATSDWETTAMKIIDILAKSNIIFPQPFQLDEFRACNTTFLLPNSVDRLYVDNKSFFANVDQGEVFETFEASYLKVRSIRLSAGPDLGRGGATLVTIRLASPPTVGDAVMARPPNDQPITLVFYVQASDLENFLKSLHNRALGDRIVRKQGKVSLVTPVSLDVDDLKMPQPSAQDKVKTVERIFDLGSEDHFYSDRPAENQDPLMELPEPISTDELPSVINYDRGLSNHDPSYAEDVQYPHDVTSSHVAGTSPVVLASLVSKHTVNPALLNVSQTKRVLEISEAGNEELSGVSGTSSVILHLFPESSRYTVLDNGSSPKSMDQRSNVGLTRARAGRIVDSEDEDGAIIVKQRMTKPFRKKKALSSDCEDEIEAVTAPPSHATKQSSVLAKENTSQIQPSVTLTRRTTTRKVSLASVDHSSHAESRATNILGHAGKDNVPDNYTFTQGSPSAPADVRLISVTTMPDKSSRLPIFDHDTTASTGDVTLVESTNTIDTMARLSNSTNKIPSNPLGHHSVSAVKKVVSDKAVTMDKDRPETLLASVKRENMASVSKKRKVETVRQEDSDPKDPEADGRSVKRLRVRRGDTKKVVSAARDASQVFGHLTTKTTRGAKRYGNGKKGRTSSPDPLTVDCDTSPPGRNRDKLSDDSKGGLVLAMKGKHGNMKGRPLAKVKGGTFTAQVEVLPTIDNAAMKPVDSRTRRSERITKADVPAQTTLKRSVNNSTTPQVPNASVESNKASVDTKQSDTVERRPLSSTLLADSKLSPQNHEAGKTWEMPMLFDGTTTSDNLTHLPIETTVIEEDARLRVSMKVGEMDYLSFEEYLVPIKGSSPPRDNVEMIDLTQDGSPVHVKSSLKTVDTLPRNIEHVNGNTKHALKSISPIRPQRPMTSSPQLNVRNNRPNRSVTFAPLPVRPVSPIKRPHEDLPETSRFTTGAGPRKMLGITPLNVASGQRYESGGSSKHEDETEQEFYWRENSEDDLQPIVDVLNEINQVVLQNISRRFDAVRSDVRSGRDRLLHDTAVEVQKMYNESAHHFHTLIDLEREYADGRRKIINCFEDMYKVGQDIRQQIRQAIQEHDRNTLSKKFPQSLFSAPVASIFENVIPL